MKLILTGGKNGFKNPIKISVETYAIKEGAYLRLIRDLFLIS